MTTFCSFGPNTVLSPFPDSTRFRPINHPFFRRTQFENFSNKKPFFRGSLSVTRFGLGQVQFPDPESSEELIRDLFSRVEGFYYTIADAAVSNSMDSVANTKQSNDWLSGITSYLEAVLKVLKDGLSTLHVPYSYGFAIILLTILVKAVTFPLTKKQVESAMAMRSLQPQIKAIQEQYAGDQERLQLETARLYKLAGINPLAGCLPTLATLPVWIGLYRALSKVADEGLLTEGFFWIPSLAGPTTIASRQSGSGTSWLFPFVDGQPPLGWSDTLTYLVLPVLLVISQYISVQIMQSSQPQSNDPNLKNSQAITKFLPLMIGYFALSVPSGLSLYWLTNNILSTAQQVWLQKMGGANNPVRQVSNDIVKEERPKIQESLFPTTIVKEEPKIEKPASEGYQPGERFKQLKEQEARRRQQREEEKSKEISLANGQPKEEADLVGKEDKGGANSLDANSVNTAINGECSSSDSNENQKTSIPTMENSEVSVHYNNGRDLQHLQENLEKEREVTVIGTSENILSGEDKHQDRSA